VARAENVSQLLDPIFKPMAAKAAAVATAVAIL
jgi:hypothetical protein